LTKVIQDIKKVRRLDSSIFTKNPINQK